MVPFIVTLGSYTVYRGFATWLASSTTLFMCRATSNRGRFTQIMKIEPEPRHGSLVRPLIWVLLGLSILVAFALHLQLPAGPRYVYAIGSEQRGD